MNANKRHPPTTSHNFLLPRIVAAMMNTESESHYEIQHDDWCDYLNGHGYCNCEPIVIELGRAQ